MLRALHNPQMLVNEEYRATDVYLQDDFSIGRSDQQKPCM